MACLQAQFHVSGGGGLSRRRDLPQPARREIWPHPGRNSAKLAPLKVRTCLQYWPHLIHDYYCTLSITAVASPPRPPPAPNFAHTNSKHSLRLNQERTMSLTPWGTAWRRGALWGCNDGAGKLSPLSCPMMNKQKETYGYNTLMMIKSIRGMSRPCKNTIQPAYPLLQLPYPEIWQQ